MELKLCKRCGVKPVLEKWHSGGPLYAVRCNNPDREAKCDWKFYHSMSRNMKKTIRIWNEDNAD